MLFDNLKFELIIDMSCAENMNCEMMTIKNVSIRIIRYIIKLKNKIISNEYKTKKQYKN